MSSPRSTAAPREGATSARAGRVGAAPCGVVALVALAAALSVSPAWSRTPVHQPTRAPTASAALAPVQARDIGPQAAAAAARSATGGTVLSVKRNGAGGRIVYRVKVLLGGGTVRTVHVDAASGSVD